MPEAKGEHDVARAVADEIKELGERHHLNFKQMTGGIAIVLAEYDLIAEESGVMKPAELIDSVAEVAKKLTEAKRTKR